MAARSVSFSIWAARQGIGFGLDLKERSEGFALAADWLTLTRETRSGPGD
jgi:hypothetical protein